MKGRAIACFAGLVCAAYSQTPAGTAAAGGDAAKSRAGVYYNFAMGRLYSGMAESESSREDLNKAIGYYEAALRLDSSSQLIFDELTDLFVQAGRLGDATKLGEEILKQHPENLNARRMLGHIYMRGIGDTERGRVNETAIKQAVEQFEKVTAAAPKDADSWVTLGRLYRVLTKSPEAEKAYTSALAADPDNEDALSGLALLYLDLGDSKRAIEKLKAVTKKNSSQRAWLTLAQAYEQVQSWKEAAESVRQAMAASQDATGRLSQELAQDLMLGEQWDEALTVYTKIAADNPRDYSALVRMAEIHRQKREYTQAEEQLAKARAIDADSLDVRYEEVNLLDAQGKTSEAIDILKGVLTATSKRNYTAAESLDRARLEERLGILCRTAGRYPAAIEAFRQTAALHPDSAARAAVQVIETYRAAKDYDSALKEAAAAAQTYPNDRMVYTEHANVLADQGKIDAAVAAFKSHAKAGENNRDSLLAIAQLYERGKRWVDMAKALDAAEKLADDDVEVKQNIWFMRGAMLERQKKFDAAEAEFRKLLKDKPEHAGALNYLGYMLADRDVRLDEARELIQKAVDLDPDNGAYLDSLGWVYYRQGKLSEARDALVKALATMNEDATVHEHLGDVYSKLGKTSDAISQWQAALKAYESASVPERDLEGAAKVNRKLESARVRLAKEGK
jgi:tetratricopeptide (TPR) repeat protein